MTLWLFKGLLFFLSCHAAGESKSLIIHRLTHVDATFKGFI